MLLLEVTKPEFFKIMDNANSGFSRPALEAMFNHYVYDTNCDDAASIPFLCHNWIEFKNYNDMYDMYKHCYERREECYADYEFLDWLQDVTAVIDLADLDSNGWLLHILC